MNLEAASSGVRDTAGSYALTEAGGEAVPAGYKRTEVGLIPEDWQVQELADLKPFITSGSRGWADYYSNHGSAFIRITNMSRDSIYLDLDDLKLVNLPPDSTEGVRTQLQDGDLLVSITADIGIIAFVDQSVPKPAYINQHIALVRLDAEKVDSKFLSYFLAGASSQKAFRAGTDQGAKAGMNLRGVREIKTAVPPLAEQHAIATALSDVDALLAKLDQLIAKKRDLKQAAMQQLFSGDIRLSGFSGDWEQKRVGELGSTYGGLTGKTKSDFGCGSARYIPFLNIVNNIVIDVDALESVQMRAAELQNKAKKGDLFFNGSSETPEEVGLCAVLTDEICDLYLNSFCFGFRLNDEREVDARYFAYLFRSPVGRNLLYSLAQGATRYNLSKRNFLNLLVQLPRPVEQAAIATILSDMDTELAALETRRDKTHELKQGMMQALLTGRIRLV
ncbi:MAG: restriction endonuclease subunit S [Rhodanobacter sp.]